MVNARSEIGRLELEVSQTRTLLEGAQEQIEKLYKKQAQGEHAPAFGDDSTERRAGNYVCWVMSVVVHTAERYEHGDGCGYQRGGSKHCCRRLLRLGGEPRSPGCEMKCMVAHQMHRHERRKT